MLSSHSIPVYRPSDGLSSSSGTSHGDAIDESHRRRSRLSEASGSSVPPMRLSLNSLHTIALALRFGRAGARTTDVVGAYMNSSCGSIASTSRLPLMALLGMLLHTNRVGFSTEMQMQVEGGVACTIHVGDAALAG